MADPGSIDRFNRGLDREYRQIIDAATTEAAKAIARRAIELFVAATPRRTGRLLSGWRVYDTPSPDSIPRVLSFRQIPIRSASQVISDASAVIDSYDAASGNKLIVINQVFYLYPYNAKRPNFEIVVNQVEGEADQLIETIAARISAIR